MRQGIDDLVDVTVVRDAIPIESIESAFMVTDDIGYIRLSQFARTSYIELLKALIELRSAGMHKLIFDLRDNSGGYLDQAIMIANEFLPQGKLIVYNEDICTLWSRVICHFHCFRSLLCIFSDLSIMSLYSGENRLHCQFVIIVTHFN